MNEKLDFKITFGDTRDLHLKKLEKITNTMNKLENELKLNEFNLVQTDSNINQIDVLLLIFQMNLIYNFDVKNADSKEYVKEFAYKDVKSKKKDEVETIFTRVKTVKDFFEYKMYNNDFFELKSFLTKYDERLDEEFELTKQSKKEQFYIKKDNYIHFILALLLNLRKIHQNDKISYDKCFKTYQFINDKDYNAEYQQLKQDMNKYLMPISSDSAETDDKKYYNYDYFKDNVEEYKRFEFIKNIESLVYDIHYLRKEMMNDFNINFTKNEVSHNIIKMSIDNMKQMIVLAYACDNTNAFVQQIQNIKTSQIWAYDNNIHCYAPLVLDEFILRFKNKFRSVITNSLYQEKDAKTNKALRFLVENSLQQYFTNEKNKFIRIKDKRKSWFIAFDNGLLEIDKTKKNSYKFSKKFDKTKLCLLSFNFDFDEQQFEYLLKNQDENKFITFVSYFIKEIRDENNNINQDKLNFFLSCVANQYQFDEDFHVFTSIIGTKGTGKSQFLNMLTRNIHNTKSISTEHDPFDYEKSFFNADFALTCLYAFKSESSIKDFTDNSNAKSAIAREFVSVNRKFEDERNVEVQTKFMMFAENEPRIRHDGGLFERSLYFYVNDKNEELFKTERYQNNNNGSIANVVNGQGMGFVVALYQAVQYQIQHIFGHGARRYKEIYRQLFSESTQKSLENTNTEVQKLLEFLDFSDSFVYEKDIITIYKLIAESNISNEITTNVSNKTIKSYLRQMSENYERNIKHDLKLNNDKFGIKKYNRLVVGSTINMQIILKLKKYYENKKNIIALDELKEIENNIKELYANHDVVEQLYNHFKLQMLEVKQQNESNDNSINMKHVFDKIDDLYANSEDSDESGVD